MVDPEGSKMQFSQGDQNLDKPIARKCFNKAHQTLGVRISPNGNWESEVQFLKQKARKYALHLHTAKLPTSETALAYCVMFLPSILYSAIVTWFTKTQWSEVDQLSCPNWLHSMGFPRNFLLAIVFAPQELGGLGFLEFFSEQGLHGIFTLMENFKANSDVGNLVKIGIEAFWLLVGRSQCAFSHPHKSTSWCYDLDDWFSNIHDFLEAHKLQLILPIRSYFQPECVRDKTLMDSLKSDWPRREICAFNRCCLYLQVLHLSNITTNDGTTVLLLALLGTCQLPLCLLWPNQAQPSTAD